MLLLLAAAAAAAAAAAVDAAPTPTPTPSPVVCKGCVKPSWSWDTLGHMAFTHTCNQSGPWSEAALDVISRFPLFNHERFMAQHQRCFELCGAAMGQRNNPCAASCWPEEGPVGRTNWTNGLYADDHLIAGCKQLKASDNRLQKMSNISINQCMQLLHVPDLEKAACQPSALWVSSRAAISSVQLHCKVARRRP